MNHKKLWKILEEKGIPDHLNCLLRNLYASQEAIVRTGLGKTDLFQILQARLQQYMNHELLDGQAGFRKGRGTRDQIANIHWIIEKAREFQKNIYFIDYTKAFDCVDHNKL